MSAANLRRAAETMRREDDPFFDAVADLLVYVDRHGLAADGVDRILRNVAETYLASGETADRPERTH